MYLSRVRLRRDASLKALLPLLLDRDRHGHLQAGHHLVWSLFADAPDRRRDFLWRETARDTFLILSKRTPQDRHTLFEMDEPKRFAPVLASGDRLQFSLRVNPVVRRRGSSDQRSAKHDVVMDALRSLPSGRRAEHRLAAVREQGIGWLQRQGDRAGFEVRTGEVQVDGYQQHRLGRGGSSRSMSFSTVDFDGLLVVRDPEALLSSIAHGFGATKAYGCGLMLIRRA